MEKHQIEIPWEVEKENAEIFIRSMLIVRQIEIPVEVEAVAPSWSNNFLITE